MVDKYMVHLDPDQSGTCVKCGSGTLTVAPPGTNATFTYVQELKKWKQFSNIQKPNEFYRCKYV